jgi:tetratricopeptide (TPR) repeat protein
VNLSFALNYRFGGLETFGYHVVNVGIHIINGLLVCWLAFLLLSNPLVSSGDKDGRAKYWLALGAGLLFVSHPVQTQAVTYIVQRLTSMAAMFYLLAVCFYIKGRYLHAAGEGRGHLWYYAGVAISGLAAFLSKEISFTLPLMLLMVEFFFIRRDKRINKRLIIFGLSGLVLAIAIGLIFRLAPTRETDDIGRWQYLITQFRVIVTYLRLLVVPVNQNLDYDFALSRSLWEIKTLLSGMFLLGLLSLGVWLYRRSRLISFGIFWFFLALSVESSIIPIRDVIFEHRMYLPLAGYCLVLAGIFYHFKDRIKPRMAVIIWAALIVGLGASAYARNQVWRDDLLLWHDTVTKSPDKARPHDARGKALMERGNHQLAEKDFIRALKIDPAYANAWYNLGYLREMKGRSREAWDCYTRAIKYKSDYAKAYNNRGAISLSLGEFDLAEKDFLFSIAAHKNVSLPYYNLAKVYYFQQRYPEALIQIKQSLALDNAYSMSYFVKALIEKEAGQYPAGIKDLQKARQMEPGNMMYLYALGKIKYSAGDTIDGRKDMDAALNQGFNPGSSPWFKK